MALPAVLPALGTVGRTLVGGANSPVGQILQSGALPVVTQLLGGQQQPQQPPAP